MRLTLSLPIFVLAVLCQAEEAPIQLERHFKALPTVRHPNFKDGVPWLNARKYIRDRMHHYGLRTMEDQVFNTTVGGKDVEGVNLIGIAEGSNKTAPIIVVGADYSTSILGNPLKDNTGGVACFLEVVHTFFDRINWYPYYQNNTVIFVAFDLNTKEFSGEGMDRAGSYYFVHEWLIPYLDGILKDKKEFRGAIILDSVTTYNPANESQHLRDGFEEAMPEAYKEITEKGSKGDFLGLLYTTNMKDNEIKETFSKRYNMDRKRTPYRLQEMELHLSPDTVTDDVMELFNHQSHYPFWTNLEDQRLPAFLLFDTEDDRTDPTSYTCNALSEECDVDEFLSKERVAFMTKTTNILLSTLLDLQTTKYDLPPSSATDSFPSILFLTLTSFIAFLLK